MTRFLIAIFFLLFSTEIFCQNYSLINKDRVYFYNNTGSGPNGDAIVNALRIDSISVSGLDSTFFNFKIFAPNSGCITLLHTGWLGNKIIKYSNSDYCFFISDTDSISIHSAAVLNDVWTVYRFNNGDYIEGTITNMTFETFIGVNDSVKTVTFQAKNALNIPITHSINNQTVKFSKTHGLTRFFELEYFPYYFDTVEICGATNPAIGSQNLTASGIFNYGVGDIFHYDYFSWMFPPNTHDYTRKKILSKIVSANLDTITYTDSVYRIRVTLDTASVILDTAVIEQIILSDYSYLDKLPMEPAYPLQAQENGGYALGFSSNINKRYRSHNPYEMYWRISDTCWQYPLIDGFPCTYYQYEGIPSNYIYYPFFWDAILSCNWSYNYHHVVYYKKGADEWGTPINFESIINSTEEIAAENPEFTFYPNPFHATTTLHFSKLPTESYTLTLYDVLGKKVYETMNVSGDVQIGNQLPAGTYSYSLSNKRIILSGKLLVF